MEEIQTAIETLLPFIKKTEIGSETGKYFSIFEHTLSEFGSYSLIYRTNSEVWEVSKQVYGRYIMLKHGDLWNMLKYIRSAHYYED